MSDNIGLEVNAAAIIVDYIWAVLRLNNPSVWDKSLFGGMVPIVPNSQVPELDDFNTPHIVYSYSEAISMQEPVVYRGNIGLVIHDQQVRRMNNTVNTIREALGRKDESATDVNNFSSGYLKKTGKRAPYLGLRFGYIRVTGIESVEPEAIEGGRESTLILLEFEYLPTYDVKTVIPESLLAQD